MTFVVVFFQLIGTPHVFFSLIIIQYTVLRNLTPQTNRTGSLIWWFRHSPAGGIHQADMRDLSVLVHAVKRVKCTQKPGHLII